MFASYAAALILAGCVSVENTGGFAREFGRPDRPSAQAQAYSHYLKGVLLESEGKFDQALEEMQRVPELDPDAITPTLRLIRGHLRQRNYTEALAMAERSVKQVPGRSNLWVVLGEIYHHLKRYEDATQAFTKAIELNPENVHGYGALVELQESTNDLVAAIDIYNRLIELNPDAPGLWYQLGINLIRINDTAGARAALERALSLSESLLRAHYFLGVLALEADEIDPASQHLEPYLEVRRDDSEGRRMLASALARRGDYQQALEMFERQLYTPEVQPRDHLVASYAALRAGDPARAENLLPPDGAPVFSALLLMLAREAAGQPYQPLLERLDEVEGDVNQELDTYLRDLLYVFGRIPTGEYLLQRIEGFEAAEIRSVTLQLLKARTLMSLQRMEEAIAVMNAVLEYHDDIWVHYQLAIAHDDLKNFDETEQHLKAFLEKQPDYPDVQNFLAYLYAEAGVKLDEAEALLNRALAADPDNPYYLDSLGWVYYKLGRADEAIDHIQRAIYGMDSDDAILRDHLGDAYLLKGDRERAVAEWERALRLDPKIEGVKEKIQQHKPADNRVNASAN